MQLILLGAFPSSPQQLSSNGKYVASVNKKLIGQIYMYSKILIVSSGAYIYK